MLSILGFVPMAVIVLIFLVVAGARAGGKEGGGGEKVIKNIYYYLVLFTTLMMVIGGSVAAFMSIADLVAPQPHYQSFEDFKRYNSAAWETKDGLETEVNLSGAELQERYNEMVSTEMIRQTARSKNSLIKSFGWIVIPLPVFIFSQRRLAKRKEEE